MDTRLQVDRSNRARGLAAAGAAFAAVAITASCGVRVDSTRTVGTAKPTNTAAHDQQQATAGQTVTASFVERAATATAAARTAHFAITVTGSGGLGKMLDIKGTGSYDLDAGSFEADMNLGSIGGDEQMVVVGGTVYLKMPAGLGGASAKPWVTMPGSGKGVGNALAGLDPKAMLNQLKTITGNLTVVGHESIDGVDTTHYHGTIDPSKIAAKAGAEAKIPSSAQGMLKGFTLPVDVWIDANGLVRREQSSISMSGSAIATPFGGSADSGLAGKLQGVGETTTIQFTDFGAPVAIVAPPADQVGAFDPSTTAKHFGAVGRTITGNTDS